MSSDGAISTIGYHGTVKSHSDSILSSNYFLPSTKPFEWLGKGVYFFTHREDANWWAKEQTVHYSEPDYVILSVELQYDQKNFFDLDIPGNIDLLVDSYRKFSQNGGFKDGAPAFEDQDQLKCFVCNLYKRRHPEVYIIAYTFDSTKKCAIGFTYKQRQLCVCKDSVIKSITVALSGIA